MNDPFVSIIVPVYNTEKFLRRCIDSILAQSYKNYELLLIDDGSKDNSGNICDDYGVNDSRIIVFHKENGGLSSARNLGINNVKGVYTIFIDSDDYWMDLNSLSLLVTTAQRYSCDIVRGEYSYVDEDDQFLFNVINPRKERYANIVMSTSDFIEHIICGKWMVCMSLFRTAILQEFNEKQRFQEDIEFHIRVFTKSLKCVYVPIQFYAYRLRSNSIVNTISSINLKSSFNLSSTFNEYSGRCEDVKTSSLYRYYSVMMYYWNLCSLVNSFYIQRSHLIEEFNLCRMQKQVSELANYNIFKFPIIIFVNPYLGCVLLRQYLRLKNNLMNLLKSIK